MQCLSVLGSLGTLRNCEPVCSSPSPLEDARGQFAFACELAARWSVAFLWHVLGNLESGCGTPCGLERVRRWAVK